MGRGGSGVPRVIVIGGSPGAGKSTLARGLQSELGAAWVDFGRLREFHLKPDWSNQSAAEESLTFDNLISILRNYVAHGWAYIIVDDLRDERIRQIPKALTGIDFRILTLTVQSETELRRRIVERNDGWKNCDAAIAWNHSVIIRALVEREHRIETFTKSQSQVLAEALAALDDPTEGPCNTRTSPT
jgi:predicted kinase